MKTKYIPYLIVLTFVLFIGFILQFVVRSMSNDTHLVSDDYYQRELDYQSQINRLNNSVELKDQVEIKKKNDTLTIDIPNNLGDLTGEIWLYNPSDPKKDVMIPFKTQGNNVIRVNLSAVPHADYSVKITFSSAEKEYYLERIIEI